MRIQLKLKSCTYRHTLHLLIKISNPSAIPIVTHTGYGFAFTNLTVFLQKAFTSSLQTSQGGTDDADCAALAKLAEANQCARRFRHGQLVIVLRFELAIRDS